MRSTGATIARRVNPWAKREGEEKAGRRKEFENCNCDWVCPCTVTSFALPATGDRCQGVLNYHVRRGEVDGTDVSGRSVSIVFDTPKKMLDGGWRIGLIIDDKATKEQADKLTGVFAGKMGGPMAGVAPLIGEVLGIERLPIEYSDDGNRHHVRIGKSRRRGGGGKRGRGGGGKKPRGGGPLPKKNHANDRPRQSEKKKKRQEGEKKREEEISRSWAG